MDPQAPGTTPSNQDLTFQVMPQDGGSGNYTAPAPAPAMAPAGSTPPPPMDYGSEPSFFRSWKFYTIIAVAAALVLGVAGWFLFGSEKPSDSEDLAAAKLLPKVWLKQYFDKELCDDASICGDKADPDTDGLTNFEEFKNGTSPVNNDTDTDGLADGDEVNIFKTEATLKYTDRRDVVAQNNWTDGSQIKSGYDPLTPGLKFTDLRLKQIEDDKARLKYHEPTITTLGAQSASNAGSLKTYANEQYKFEIKTPADWVSEPVSGTGKGLYDLRDGKEPFSAIAIAGPQATDYKPNTSVSPQTVKLNGYDAALYSVNPGSMEVYVINHNNLIFSIFLTFNKNSEQAVKQVLSTFKFLD